MSDWPFRHNHATGKNEEKSGIHLGINNIEAWPYILQCITAEEIREVTLEHKYLSTLAECVLHGCVST